MIFLATSSDVAGGTENKVAKSTTTTDVYIERENFTLNFIHYLLGQDEALQRYLCMWGRLDN